MSDLMNYEKLAELEKNAYSRVYRGYDHAGDRSVRIIEFHASLASDPARWDQIWAEVVSAAGTNQQNTVSVYAVLREPRWVVTEWLDANLGELLPRRRMSPDEVRNVLRQGLRALQRWHERGKLHGDVRPATLLFHDGDFIKLNYSPGLELGGQVLLPERGLK